MRNTIGISASRSPFEPVTLTNRSRSTSGSPAASALARGVRDRIARTPRSWCRSSGRSWPRTREFAPSAAISTSAVSAWPPAKCATTLPSGPDRSRWVNRSPQRTAPPSPASRTRRSVTRSTASTLSGSSARGSVKSGDHISFSRSS
ncbi:hypothetical protein ACFQHO_12290 [Actinomadura yumaensis]|uniref:hypothetical protein n=1 Tax=Actinomadura yumaensis TaxID=111807 RepID=UPI00361E0903